MSISRLLSDVDWPAAALYLALSTFLVSSTLSGPFERWWAYNTKFVTSDADPSDLPAPTVTICRLGAALKTKWKPYRHFFADAEAIQAAMAEEDGQPQVSLTEQFTDLEEYYIAGEVRLSQTTTYSTPLWAPNASDWRPVVADINYLGRCYNLDLSERVDPGQTWHLSMVLNGSDLNGWGRPATLLVIREKEEDFYAGVSKAAPHLPEMYFVQPGVVNLMPVTGKVQRLMTDCDESGRSYTSCVYSHLAEKYPGCTMAMLAEDESSCSNADLTAVMQAKQDLLMSSAESVHRRTGCKKRCKTRRYKIATVPFNANAIMEVDPDVTYLFIEFDNTQQIQLVEEVDAYSFTDFQADVGGLSGLLLGLSIYGLAIGMRNRARECWEAYKPKRRT